MSDASLAVVVARGCSAGFAELYRRHANAVYGLAARLCRSDGAADVTQEVFVTFWRAPERFDPARGTLRSYLLVIAQHKAIDLVRAENRRYARQQRAASMVEQPRQEGLEVEAIAADRADRITAALNHLPRRERDALVVAFYGERTYQQTAALLGQPEGTTKSRIRSGLRHLGESLAEGSDLAEGSALPS